MKNRCSLLFIFVVCILAIGQSLNAQESKAGKPKQFIYILKLVPRLYSDSAWTNEDSAVLKRHFVRFQEAAKSGQLILAGRTSEPGDKAFGIAIFEAADEEAARKFMQEDPAVVGGLMTAELPPVCGRASTQESVARSVIDGLAIDAEREFSQNARPREMCCRAEWGRRE